MIPVGAIQDGVGHVRGLGARGQPAGHHGFEHLRGRDDRLARQAGLGDQLLLQDGHLFDRHFHAEVAAGHHDAVRRLENFVKAQEGVRAFDLGDDEGLSAEGLGGGPHGFDVRGGLHEGLAHGVHALAERKFQAGAVVVGERADAEINARQVKPLLGA
jgi:hypothetical protein